MFEKFTERAEQMEGMTGLNELFLEITGTTFSDSLSNTCPCLLLPLEIVINVPGTQ
jgi:hypothetical protein